MFEITVRVFAYAKCLIRTEGNSWIAFRVIPIRKENERET